MLRLNHLRKGLQNTNLTHHILKSKLHVSKNLKQILASAQLHNDYKNDKFQKDDVIHGFVVNEVARIDELYITAIRLSHLGTGAQYMHLLRDDSNNVFSTNFRTTPRDSTGLPHILEHTTLCGSQKYDCRDPFFKMLRRSLATFMNAMTGPDYTLYPFSTQNKKDFRNLQSVYLDSVFRPNLRELDFRQEGWRLEHTDVNDKNSPVIFKGVVFNEMKGVFNQNSSIFAEKLLNTILPSHTYSVISGGDPLVIPTLTHQDLLNFHANYYHPSNARFYSYGNFPLEDHLKFLNEEYLEHSNRIDVRGSEVPPEKRWQKPKNTHVTCNVDPMIADPNRQGTIAIAHLCNDITDIQQSFELYVLSKLLLSGPNTAFYKSLIDSNVSTGYGPVTGYDSQCKDTMFSVSLQGVKPEEFEKIEKIYKETVQSVIEKGFEKEHIESIFNNIEMSIKHQTSNFGLGLLFNLTPLWNHNGNLVESMRINAAVNKLKNKIKENPQYLQKLVQKYLLENNHKLTLTMTPEENYSEQLQVKERELLEEKLNALSQEEKDRIFEEGQTLLAEQQKQEDVAALPTLKISDLKENVDRYDLNDLQVAGVPVQLTVQPTNGICYYRGLIDTKNLPTELKNVLPIFNNVLAKMGTKNYDYRRFDQMIQLKTGGLFFSNHVAEHKDSTTQYDQGILIDSYSLDRNVPDMWNLWVELFNNVKLTDMQRFETLVKMSAASLVDGIASSGHHYAMSTAASLVSPISHFKESLSGLQYVKRMKSIAQMKDLTPVLLQIQEISEYILNKSQMRSALNICEPEKDQILKSVESFYGRIRSESSKVNNSSTNEPVLQENSSIHHVLPYAVNYTSKAIATVPFLHPDYAALRILSKLISSTYLHPEIREKGGAYGGGARLTGEGVFAFYSYRDPNSTKTLDIFDGTYEHLTKCNLQQTDIDEAKLGIFQTVDSPVSPSARGMSKFLRNVTYDEIQKHREALKTVTKEDLLRVAERYLKPDRTDVNIGRCLIGPANNDLKNRQSENWTILDQEEDARSQLP